jgi:hypothetical protein
VLDVVPVAVVHMQSNLVNLEVQWLQVLCRG